MQDALHSQGGCDVAISRAKMIWYGMACTGFLRHTGAGKLVSTAAEGLPMPARAEITC